MIAASQTVPSPRPPLLSIGGCLYGRRWGSGDMPLRALPGPHPTLRVRPPDIGAEAPRTDLNSQRGCHRRRRAVSMASNEHDPADPTAVWCGLGTAFYTAVLNFDVTAGATDSLLDRPGFVVASDGLRLSQALTSGRRGERGTRRSELGLPTFRRAERRGRVGAQK